MPQTGWLQGQLIPTVLESEVQDQGAGKTFFHLRLPLWAPRYPLFLFSLCAPAGDGEQESAVYQHPHPDLSLGHQLCREGPPLRSHLPVPTFS